MPRARRSGRRTAKYRLELLVPTAYTSTFVVTAEGKIAELSLEPESRSGRRNIHVVSRLQGSSGTAHKILLHHGMTDFLS